MTDWFKADTWPLEAAVIWIATGDARLFQQAAEFAQERRVCPAETRTSLGIWLMVSEGKARGKEVPDGALYRGEIRQGWSRNAEQSSGGHPFNRALCRTAETMAGKHSTGQRGTDSSRAPIPGALWKSAYIIDDKSRGLILRLPAQADDTAWQKIDVPAGPFRMLRAKRGRRPAGLSDAANVPDRSAKNIERLKRKKTREDQRYGLPSAPRKRGGRPKGSRDRH